MSDFSSKAAEDAAKGLSADQLESIEPSGKGGKITKGDIDAAKAGGALTDKKASPSKGRKRIERVRPDTQAWVDPYSGDEVLLRDGVPSSGARIETEKGGPVTTLLSEDETYFAVVD